MSNEKGNEENVIPAKTVIPAELIRETIMPPYEYQTPQTGFGSTSTDHSPSNKEVSKKS